ncbi:hypothetical protein SAMN05216312_101466 [Cohnella sp. OV330]|uniref:hypothetical protein n=1 Tax=Cohnella sp. OV330 TaxID=1855288 RepID=UPI0008F15C82|nr:hypothetical protein [Cohnella sp. OV330]SFA78459.1 hypothetical protein SAMN05216312_101466 [Cohnella sp. OV330]
MNEPLLAWNEQLEQAKRDLALRAKWTKRRTELVREVEQQRREESHWSERLASEQDDVERMRAASFSQFVLQLFGKLDEKLSKEEREAAEAKLKRDAAAAALLALEREQSDVIGKLVEVEYAERRCSELLAMKEQWIREYDATAWQELEAISAEIGQLQSMKIEFDEAIRAGLEVEGALEYAGEKLSSARGWGTHDLFGGGLISTAVKHGLIDEASVHIHHAEDALRRFGKELADLNQSHDASVPQVSGLLKFSDFFFDGLLADWMVQGRIDSSIESVRARNRDIGRLIGKLQGEKKQLEYRIAAMNNRRQEIVESYGGR